MSHALLVIDVQNDFCPGGALAVRNGDEVVAPINTIMDNFDTVILTQDWHPANHVCFATNQPGKQPFDMVELPYGSQVLWPVHCIQGSKGAAFHPQLNTDAAHLVIRKGFRPHIDSYSAFFENDHTTPTGLSGYLKSRNTTDITLVGLATDFCVAFSALDAVKAGLKVRVISAACRGINLDGSLNSQITTMRNAGIVIT